MIDARPNHEKIKCQAFASTNRDFETKLNNHVDANVLAYH